MSEFDKPPPYSPQAPAPTTTQPTMGYQAGPYIPPASEVHGGGQQAWGYPVTQVSPNTMPAYGSTIYIQQPPPASPQILLVGGCPACRVGVLEEDFTCLGVCMAIFFFPLGILCCLAMMQRRCPNCGAIFR